MKHHLPPLQRLIALPLILAALQLTATETLAAQPHLQFTAVSGYQLAFKGSGWGSQARVSLRFSQDDTVQHLTVVAARNGVFIVGANEVNACADVTVSAHDRAGHRVTIRRPERGCPSPIDIPPATLTVLTGKVRTAS